MLEKNYKYVKIGDRKNTNKVIGQYKEMIWKETTKVVMVLMSTKTVK